MRALRPVEYRVPDRLREPTAFELTTAAERLLKRTLNELTTFGGARGVGLCEDIRAFLAHVEDGRSAIHRAKQLVEEDDARLEQEADFVRKRQKAPHHQARRRTG